MMVTLERGPVRRQNETGPLTRWRGQRVVASFQGVVIGVVSCGVLATTERHGVGMEIL